MTETAVVTGAAGFIGRHLVRRLAGEAAAVRAHDLRLPATEPRGSAGGAGSEAEASGGNGRISWYRGDIRDTDALRPLLRGADTLYHLAALHLEVGRDAAAFREVNVEAVGRLVAAAAEAGVRRVVHTSSVGVYGHVASPPADEDAPTRPVTPYERSKLEGEEAALRAAAAAGVELVVLRPAWVYGPGCPRTAKLLRALRKRRFFYVGDGSNLRHPLYVADLLDAFRRAADGPSGRIGGRRFNIAGPRWMPLREMVEAFAEEADAPAPRARIPRALASGLGRGAEIAFGLAGRHPPFSRRSLAFFENDNAFDTAAARRDLGFRPAVELADGVRRTLADGAGA